MSGAGVWVLLALAAPRSAWSQSYTAAQLDCARFHESARSEIETESGGRQRRALAEREGSWTFRARDTVGGASLEGWYETLALRHGSGDTLAVPDTDGIIGGRYRGLLRSTGEYRRLVTPFVPDEVAEAVDATAALDDLFPRLPPGPLAVGSRWTDGAGLEIERLPDSSAAGATLQRYAVGRRHESSEAVPHGDTLAVPLRQTSVETARVVWHPDQGLQGSDRELVIEAFIPAGDRVRLPVRSRVRQHATLLRLPPSPSCR